MGEHAWMRRFVKPLIFRFVFARHSFSSEAEVGTLLPQIAKETGMAEEVKVFAGGADNACGALVPAFYHQVTHMQHWHIRCHSSYEENHNRELNGNLHLFHHGKKRRFLNNGSHFVSSYSLDWIKSLLAPNDSFKDL